ncbi:hypothetical protein BH20ACT2_BH20ACT2_10610 [soil metagenome]
MTVLAALLLVGAVVAAVYAFAAGATARSVSAALTVTCADATTADGVIAVSGTAEPGPEGPVHAPLSGTACVWYEVETVERWDDHEDDDDPATGRGTRTESRRQVSDRPFVLRDAFGTVLVDPHGGAKADHLPVSFEEHGVAAGDTPGESRADHKESVLVTGDAVFVTAEVVAHRDGLAVLGGPGLLVSGRTGAAIRAAGQTGQRAGAVIAIALAAAGVVVLLLD